MARLPQPGGDSGNWGEILNEYLSQSLNADGTLKTDTVGAVQLQPQSVTNAAIADATIQESKLSTAVQTKLNSSGVSQAQLDAVNTALSNDIDTKQDKEVGKGLSENDYTSAEKTKLSGIAAGATQNAADAALRDRTTHTGEQAVSTVTGLQAALDAKASDSGVVHTTGSEVINGDKTFNNQVSVELTSGNMVLRGRNTLLSSGNAGSGIGLYSDDGAALAVNDRLGYVLLGGSRDGTGALSNSVGLFAYANENWNGSASGGRLAIEAMPNGSITRSVVATMSAASFQVDPAVTFTATGPILTNPTLSGTPIAPTATVNTNSTQIATTAYADTIKSTAMGVVTHGAVAGTARPVGYGQVTWIGSVTPTNAITNDIWVFKP